MKRFLGLATGVFLLIGFSSSAQAINIDVAEVQNGSAVVQGGKAAANATITWEGGNVATANKNGGFKFSGIVPADCIGTLSDGVSTIPVVVLDCTPISAAFAPVPRTGQTTSYAAGDDGALQKGIAWPNPRFTDNNNGTVTDNLTGLIWLKNANCIGTLYPLFDNDNVADGQVTWQHALDFVASINSGTYDCKDRSNGGSQQTDWRLPNRNELASLVDLGQFNPAFPSGHPFTNFQNSNYWSSSTHAHPDLPSIAWFVFFPDGSLRFESKAERHFFVTAVRGGS